MADIWLWNSIATRKRSPSDGFLENGLAMLKSYLAGRGHNVKVIDWQKNEFYNKLCFRWLLSVNRFLTAALFRLAKAGKIYAKLFYPLFSLSQEAVTLVRKRRMRCFLRKFGDEVIKSGIKIFGIKAWYGEAFTWAGYLAEYIKEKDPSILLIAGGFHVTLYEEDFLVNSVFDFGVISEGERPAGIIAAAADKYAGRWDKGAVIREITEKIASGELKNMVYRDEGGRVRVTERYTPEMKNKVLPQYDTENVEGKLKIHVLLDSLGCPWGKCNFCVHSHFYPRFYPRPTEEIVAEMEHMIKSGIGLFRFAGSETPPAFGVKIARGIIDKRLRVRYSIGCRAISGITNSPERYRAVVENFALMLRAGLRAVFVGGESGNDVINEKIMNKGVKAADIIRTAAAFREAGDRAGIRAYFSLALIYPSPLTDGITNRQVFDDNLKLIEKTAPDSVIISPCTPFKHTTWNREKARFGFTIPDEREFIRKVMSYEYVLYKPPSLWPPLGGLKMRDLTFTGILEECGRLRSAVEKKGIPADLTDEYFLMLESAGYSGKKGLELFKKETSIDLVSSDYRNIGRITERTNCLSEELARSHFAHSG